MHSVYQWVGKSEEPPIGQHMHISACTFPHGITATLRLFSKIVWEQYSSTEGRLLRVLSVPQKIIKKAKKLLKKLFVFSKFFLLKGELTPLLVPSEELGPGIFK